MIKKHKKIILMIALSIILIVLDLAWVCIAILVFALIYNMALHLISLIHYVYPRKIVKGIFLFLFLLSSVISVKLLAFDVYKIPSSSMENILYPGDVIVVNKLTYGPKLPHSPFEIPWINLAFYMNKNARAKMKETWWNYSRWGGTSKIKQGDVFVFTISDSLTYFVVKRCVGLSGDTLSIKKGEIYTNSILFNSPETVKNIYSFSIKNKEHLYTIKDSINLQGYINHDDKKRNWGSAIFSKQEFNLLEKENCIDSVNKKLEVYGISQGKLLKTTASKWTLDDMGPIIIPKKGMEINLNPDTFMLYEKILTLFEKSKITENNGAYFIDGKSTKTYRFKLNYYFMIGDNRKDTYDSRYWGFLPENNIVGKVQCILFSNKNNKFQWNRLFKML